MRANSIFTIAVPYELVEEHIFSLEYSDLYLEETIGKAEIYH